MWSELRWKKYNPQFYEMEVKLETNDLVSGWVRAAVHFSGRDREKTVQHRFCLL